MERLLDDAREHLLRKLAETKEDTPWSEIENLVRQDVARLIAKRSHRHPLILPLITRI